MKVKLLYLSAFILSVFGVLTLFMSSSVLFDLFGIREKEGNFVPFIVWANWLCGFLYLIAAYGFLKIRKWAIQPLLGAAIVLIVAFVALLIYIEGGGVYEQKTVYAMAFRTSVTLVFTVLAYLLISKRK
ncbi:MAG: hypothetical protein M9958_11195 [Chitinophagales bacterium]|nr:hypothetical protein [Chitinophagales bacterium]